MPGLQQASKLVGTGAVGSPSKASPSHDRNDNSGTEAAWQWHFVQPLATVPFLTFSAQLQIAFGRTPNHDPFALESSFTLSSTEVRRFRYRGIEPYV